MSTSPDAYANRLHSLQGARWKQTLDVQRPYRRHLQRVCEGEVLEVGCGVGRNLRNLRGRILGVDVDAHAVAIAREQGLDAVVAADFLADQGLSPRSFGTLLISHVLEHLSEAECDEFLQDYLPWLADSGLVVIECPQEVGYRSDDSHVRWMAFSDISQALERSGIEVIKEYSFPFPRGFGKVFKYNEFVVVGRKCPKRADA
jgi:2-polyprenyl-3-methyl-5-hydroxy-6-metoxy-1,4-benzoquinol methylase